MAIDANGPMARVMAAFVLLGAGSLVSPWAMAQTAGSAAGLPGTGGAAAPGSTLAGTLRAAQTHLAQGRLIEARDAVSRLLDPAAMARLTGEERDAAAELLGKIDAQMRSADPVEMSLQRAELAVKTGDLSEAASVAERVMSRRGASDAAKARE